MAIIALK